MFKQGIWRTLGEPRLGYPSPLRPCDPSGIEYGIEYGIDQAIASGPYAVEEPRFTVYTEFQYLPRGSLDRQRHMNVLDDTDLVQLVRSCSELIDKLTSKGSSSASCLWYEQRPDVTEGWTCLPKEPRQTMEALLFEPLAPSEMFQRFARNLTRYLRGTEPVSVPEQSVDGIEHLYELGDSAAVTSFLEDHQDLVPVLSDAASKIRQADFFPAARLSLEFFVDPEDESDDTGAVTKVVIVIATQLSAEEAFDRYSRLQASWWLDVFVKYGDRLGLDVEFV